MIIDGCTLPAVTFRDLVTSVTENMRDTDRRELRCTLPEGVDEERYWIDMAVLAQDGSYICIDKHDKPVCVGGISTHHKGVGSAWLWATDGFEKHRIEITRFITRNVERYLREEGHRVQCLTAAFHDYSIGWLQLAGFEKEGELPCFGVGKEKFLQFGITR